MTGSLMIKRPHLKSQMWRCWLSAKRQSRRTLLDLPSSEYGTLHEHENRALSSWLTIAFSETSSALPTPLTISFLISHLSPSSFNPILFLWILFVGNYYSFQRQPCLAKAFRSIHTSRFVPFCSASVQNRVIQWI